MKKIIIFLMALMLFGPANEYLLTVSDFDFLNALVLLEDEQGNIWTCPFGENDWNLGENYILRVTQNQIEILEVEHPAASGRRSL